MKTVRPKGSYEIERSAKDEQPHQQHAVGREPEGCGRRLAERARRCDRPEPDRQAGALERRRVQFRSIHLDLDELVTTAREFTDQVAERLTAIGVSPDGRVATVARDSGAKGFGDGWSKDTEVVASIVGNLAAVIARLREGIEITGNADPVTQDLLIGQAARLEQLHWMWQAQLA